MDKLIQCGDGDAALLYLYVIRQGRAFDEQTAKRDLRLSDERFTRASFTLTGLVVEQQPAAPARPEHAPRYTAAELRRARQQDHRFQAVCDAAENVLGHALTDALLRTLYTVYDHIALPAEVIIELLSYLGRDRGTFKGRDIEREACIWADKGILTTADAQRYLAVAEAERPPARRAVPGAGRRRPAARPPPSARLWRCAWRKALRRTRWSWPWRA